MTKQKQAYADARMRGLNFKDSAIAAGYSEKGAKQAGSRLEKDPDVKAAIGRAVSGKPVEVIQSRPLPIPDDVYIPATVKDGDPLKFLVGVMNDAEADPKLRLDAAKAIASFTIAKPGEKGKKEQKDDEAKKVASKFKVQRLKAVK